MVTLFPAVPDTQPARSDVPRLSRRAFWTIAAIALVIFLVADNPLLGDPFSIDRSIIYSYLPIPLLVAIALMLERRFDARSLAIETALIMTVKFGITYVLATLLYVFAGEPPAPRPPPPSRESTAGRALFTAVPLPAADADVPTIWLRPRGASSSPIRIAAGEVVVVRGDPDTLHTVRAELADGSSPFNLAFPAGERRALRFARPLGVVHLSCTVHPGERFSDLIVDDR